MAEGVTLVVVVQLEINPAVKSSGATPPTPDALKPPLADAINLLLASGTRNLKRQDLVSAIRAKVAASAPQFQLTADKPLALNFTFVWSGRMLKNPDTA